MASFDKDDLFQFKNIGISYVYIIYCTIINMSINILLTGFFLYRARILHFFNPTKTAISYSNCLIYSNMNPPKKWISFHFTL